MVDRAEVEPMDIGLEDKPISDHHWSPDSRWLAYSKIGLDHVSNVYLYSLDTGTTHNVSNGLFNDFGPVFTPDGQHLLFVSNRRFNPTLLRLRVGDGLQGRGWDLRSDFACRRRGVVAAVVRRGGGGRCRDRRVARETERAKEGVEVRVDLDGIAARIEALPVPASNYRDLAPGDDAVYFLDGDDGDFNRFEYRRLPPRTLKKFDLEDRETSTVAERINEFVLAADGEHVVWRRGDTVGIIESNGAARRMRAMMASKSGGPSALQSRRPWTSKVWW